MSTKTWTLRKEQRPAVTVPDTNPADSMNSPKKESSIQRHVSSSCTIMLCTSHSSIPDKHAVDSMSPGDAVVVFTPDSWFSFEATANC